MSEVVTMISDGGGSDVAMASPPMASPGGGPLNPPAGLPAAGGRGRGTRKSNRGVAGFKPSSLRSWRTSCGLEQKELADKVGITPGGLSHIEKGKRQPMIDTVVALATALSGGPRGKCTPADLVDLEELQRVEPTMLAKLVAEMDPEILRTALQAQKAKHRQGSPTRSAKTPK